MTEWRNYLMQKQIDEFNKKQAEEAKKWLAEQQAKREDKK